MSLPENLNNIEHLQKTWNQEHNRRVDRYFKDVQGNGDLSGVRPSFWKNGSTATVKKSYKFTPEGI